MTEHQEVKRTILERVFVGAIVLFLLSLAFSLYGVFPEIQETLNVIYITSGTFTVGFFLIYNFVVLFKPDNKGPHKPIFDKPSSSFLGVPEVEIEITLFTENVLVIRSRVKDSINADLHFFYRDEERNIWVKKKATEVFKLSPEQHLKDHVSFEPLKRYPDFPKSEEC